MPGALKIETEYIDKQVAEGIFRELLQERPAYRVLNIYGESGLGKSYFLEHIKQKYLKKDYIFIELDFANRLLHKPNSAIMSLAKELETKYDFNFLSLWKAYAILWQKRYNDSPLISAIDLPYFNEIKKLLKKDGKGNFFIDIIKGLFKDSIYKELEKLKKVDTQVIENSLYKFFAEDLRNLIKQHNFKDCVIFIKNRYILDEMANKTPCQKDAWIRDFIVNVGKDALFVIESRRFLNWQGCNIAWKSQVKSYEFQPFIYKESIRYLSQNGIKDSALKEALATVSGGVPFWLYLSLIAYKDKKDIKYPVTKQDIFSDFIKILPKDLVRLLKVLSQARVFGFGLIEAIIAKYDLKISKPEILEFLNSGLVLEISKNRYELLSPLKEELNKILTQEELKDYKILIFGYYEDVLHSIKQEDIAKNKELIDNAIEEAWYYLTTISNEPLVHFEWLDYYIDKFFTYAAWEPFIDRYLQIIPKLKEASDKTSKNKLVTLYNNLAGLYESIGEIKKSKAFYKKVINLNRPKLLSA